MMVRANLGQLLGNVGESTAPSMPKDKATEQAGEPEPSVPEVVAKVARPPSRVPPAIEKQTAVPSAEDSSTPTYLRYVRDC